jgi:hypothetical protein
MTIMGILSYASSMLSTQTTQTINILKALPKELRGQVFDLLIDEQWSGKIPDIIKALRTPDTLQLYCEVLYIFHSRNFSYELNERNDWGCKNMPKTLVSTIGRVCIRTK